MNVSPIRNGYGAIFFLFSKTHFQEQRLTLPGVSYMLRHTEKPWLLPLQGG
jgi:hypothetical protein